MTFLEKVAFGTLALVFILALALQSAIPKLFKGLAMRHLARSLLIAAILCSGAALSSCSTAFHTCKDGLCR